MIKAILAVGENGEIGQNGDMPWGRDLPKDLAYFKEQTLRQNVIIGRKTFYSLPFNGKGFPERATFVLTKEKRSVLTDKGGWATIFFTQEDLKRMIFVKGFWVAGGSQTYKTFSDLIEEYHITRLKHSFPDADTFFEPDLTGFEKVGEDVNVSSDKYEAYVEVWRRKP